MTTNVKASDIGEVIPLVRPAAPAPVDPFSTLMPHTIEKMRGVVTRVQALGLPLEVHPQLAGTFSFAMDGALYSVSAVGPREELVVTVQGRIGAITFDDLMNILPDAEAPAAPAPPRLSPLPPERPHPTDVMLLILEELKTLNARLSG